MGNRSRAERHRRARQLRRAAAKRNESIEALVRRIERADPMPPTAQVDAPDPTPAARRPRINWWHVIGALSMLAALAFGIALVNR